MRPVSLRAAIGAAFALAICSSPLFAAGQIPQNVGYGLDKLIESRLALARGEPGPFGGYVSQQAQQYAEQAITDAATGRVMVDITLTGRVSIDDVRSEALRTCSSLTVTAEDRAYRSTGILEGWVSVDQATALSRVKGVRGVFLALKPTLDSVRLPDEATSGNAPAPNVEVGDSLVKLGTAFDQGVTQHRVDRINKYYNPAAPIDINGNGISIGAMSDSYDTRTAAPHAATGVANFDLPGAAGHPLNTQPVVVLHEHDPASGTDEGRAMVEILHKMAPKARLGFAQGVVGEVAFANDIKALAGVPGFTYPAGTQQGFKADVIVDDISYGGEPFYGETIIGNAIDDVTALGVSYFSSAGNNIGINAYESPLRLVPNGTGVTAATNSALVGTNIDLTGVPAALYAGGFHNFNPNPGQLDVAQLVNMPSTPTPGSTEMQWDDPYDQHDLTLVQPPIMSASGVHDGVTPVTYDNASTPALPVFTAGTAYVINVVAPNAPPNAFDAIVTIRDPGNNVILTQDTGTDELINFFPPTTGQYKIVITAFGGTTGAFNITVNTATGNTAGVTTDLNLLVFRADTGAFISAVSLTANNLANNRPVELGVITSASGQTQSQFVIARANTPAATVVRPTRVRWSTRGNGAANIGPAEYFTYNAVTTKGHASAKGCNGTAAYSPFRPSLPESFSSPGPATILFDKNANRLAVPEIREVPRLAATDAANNSFFAGDSGSDLDTNPNFSGTSAAAPHAAAIAALVLQSRGGPGSVTPAAMRTILQKNTFPHDLDPSAATGITTTTSDGGGVVIQIDSDNDNNLLTGENDLNSIQVSYVGPGSLATLVFNPGGTAATGGNVTGGNNGIQDALPNVTYFDNSYPGLVFLPATRAFALGTLTGLVPADVTIPLSTAPFTGFSNLAPLPANGTSQFFTMSLAFPNANFVDGKVVRFTVARGAAHSSSVVGTVPGTGPTGGTITRNPIADVFGGGVKIPSGQRINDGMTFSGTTTGGGTFSGVIRNKIGRGYSKVDGYGFIDAMSAVDRIYADDVEGGN